jgi:hypothetical protein
MALETDLPAYTAAAKLMYIKLPMYLFFYMALGLNDFDGGQIHFKGHLLTCMRGLYFCAKTAGVAVVHQSKNGKILCLNFNAYLQVGRAL